MIPSEKKWRIATAVALAALTLLAVFNFSAGAEKKAVSKLSKGVKSVPAVMQLATAPENHNLPVTVRGIYAGGNSAAAILLKSPPAENGAMQQISCYFVAGTSAEISAVPLQSEFVVSGNIGLQNGQTVLTNCRLITINIPVAQQ